MKTLEVPKVSISKLQRAKDIVQQIDQGTDDLDGFELLMGELQKILKGEDESIAVCLCGMLSSKTLKPETRSFILETFLGARVFSDLAKTAVSGCLWDEDEGVRFTAIAASVDLPRALQVKLTNDIERMAKTDNSLDVRRAAEAHLVCLYKRG